MTPESALARTRKLLALAAEGSGATQEEARSAAAAAANLILEHRLLDGGQPKSAINLDQVADLALHAAELEHLLAAERAAHADTRAAHGRALKARDQEWRVLLDRVRREERVKADAERATAERKAVRADRTAQGRAGGRERARRLTSERKTEIGRKGAAERWARWRQERGLAPR